MGGAEKFAPFAKFAPTSEIWFGPIATLQILPSIVNVVQLVSEPIVTPVMLTDFLYYEIKRKGAKKLVFLGL